MTDDVRKLVGGYATGTLTEAERQQLFSAALEDQALFEALADEQALADLLEDASARATLLHAAENPEFSTMAVFRDWFSRPKAKVLAALGCAAVIGIAVQTYQQRQPAEYARTAPRDFAIHTPPAEKRAEQPQALSGRVAKARPPAANVAGVPSETLEQKQKETAAGVGAAASAPKAEALATTPPPAAVQTADSESATRTVVTAGVELQYTLLRRTGDRTDVAVPASHPFTATDRVRLRVQASQDGMFEIRRDGAPMYTGAASAGTPIVVPAELGFTEAAMHTVDIRFTQLPPMGSVSSRMEFRDNTLPTAAPAVAARRVAAPQNPVSTQIILRRASQ